MSFLPGATTPPPNTPGMENFTSESSLGSAPFQRLFGWIRRLLFLALPVFIGALVGWLLDGVQPSEVAETYTKAIPLFGKLPYFFQILIASLLNRWSWPYMIVPLIAEIGVLYAAANYIQDIYALPDFGTAFRYVFASMFAFRQPMITVDGGSIRLTRGRVNPIEVIGGPGLAVVEPGSGAIFRRLRRLSQPVINQSYYLEPFEQIEITFDLDEQQGDRDQITSMTRDGIQVILQDVHFRYRIRQRDAAGRPVNRAPDMPFPFDPADLTNMIANLSVTTRGRETWNAAIERVVIGMITDFIEEHTIDYLTAPARNGDDPRRALMNQIFANAQGYLSRYGAELIWIDAGHLDIRLEAVDEERLMMWASRWVGDANITRSYGEALRQAYRELGRAQAQAEIILSIMDALNVANLNLQAPANIRKLMLARTAQVLDAMTETLPEF